MCVTSSQVGREVLVRNHPSDRHKKRILVTVVTNITDTERPYICLGKNGIGHYAWVEAKQGDECDSCEAEYRDVTEEDVNEIVEVSANERDWKERRLVAIDDQNERSYVTSNDEDNGGWFWRFARIKDEC